MGAKRGPDSIPLLRAEAAAWLLNELLCGEHAVEPTEANLAFAREIVYGALLHAIGEAQAEWRRRGISVVPAEAS